MDNLYEQLAGGLYEELAARMIYREYSPGGYYYVRPRALVLVGRLIEILPYGTMNSPVEIIIGDRHCIVQVLKSDQRQLIEYSDPEFFTALQRILRIGGGALVNVSCKATLPITYDATRRQVLQRMYNEHRW